MSKKSKPVTDKQLDACLARRERAKEMEWSDIKDKSKKKAPRDDWRMDNDFQDTIAKRRNQANAPLIKPATAIAMWGKMIITGMTSKRQPGQMRTFYLSCDHGITCSFRCVMPESEVKAFKAATPIC